MNSVFINGNLGHNAELRHTANGLPVLDFSVCINNRKKVNGEWTDNPCWVDCVMFGKRAENKAGLLNKGTEVVIQGHLDQSQWEKNGEKRYKLRIIIDGLLIVNSQELEQKPAQNSGVYADENIPF